MANIAVSISVSDKFKLAQRMAKSPDVVQNQLNKALLNIAIDVERQAKREVPVITGRLQNSIETTRQHLRYTIKPTVNYAEWVHEGNKARNATPGQRVSRYAGNPFMDRTFNIIEPNARRELNSAIKDIIAGI